MPTRGRTNGSYRALSAIVHVCPAFEAPRMNFYQAAASGVSAAHPGECGGDAIAERMSSPIELHAYVMRRRKECLPKHINITKPVPPVICYYKQIPSRS